jgi:hypothetical protein
LQISRTEERRSEMNVVLEDPFGDNFGGWTNWTFVMIWMWKNCLLWDHPKTLTKTDLQL